MYVRTNSMYLQPEGVCTYIDFLMKVHYTADLMYIATIFTS